MNKFLNKSLIATMSSLCAFSSSIDASFKADKEITLEEALENSDEMGRILNEQIRGQKKAERSFIAREGDGTFTKYKDIAQHIILGIVALGGAGVIGACTGEVINKGPGAGVGALFGVLLGIPLFIPTIVRTIKDKLRKPELLKAVQRLSTLYENRINAKATRNEKRSESEGDLVIS